MSQENVEVVQTLVAASQRGDWEAALDTYDPAVELDESRMPDGGVYHGVGELVACSTRDRLGPGTT